MDWTLSFNSSTLADQTLTLTYDVGKGKNASQLQVRLLDPGNSTCNLTSSSTHDEIQVSKSIITQSNSSHDEVACNFTYDTSLITNSSFYSKDGNKSAKLRFCARLDLHLDENQNFSISFEETFVDILFNLTSGLGVFSTKAELEKKEANEVNKETSSQVNAFLCNNDNNELVDMVYQQNKAIRICVAPDSTYKVEGFQDVELLQGGVSKQTIVDSEGTSSNSLTQVTPGAVGVISTRLTSDFFETANPPPVDITGKVKLDLAGDRRALKGTGSRSDDDHASFSISIKLEPKSSSFDPLFLLASGALVLVLLHIIKGIGNQRNVRYGPVPNV